METTLLIDPFVTCSMCSPPKTRRSKTTLRKHYFSDCFVCLKAKNGDDPLATAPGGIVGLYLRKGEATKAEVEIRMKVAIGFANEVMLSDEFLLKAKHDIKRLFYGVELYKLFVAKISRHFATMCAYSLHACRWRPELLQPSPERSRRFKPLDNWDLSDVDNVSLSCVVCGLTRSKTDERLWMGTAEDEHWMNRSFLFDPNPLDPFNVCLEMQCPSTAPTVFCRSCWFKMQNTEFLVGIKRLFWELGPLAIDGEPAHKSRECKRWIEDVWKNNVF